MPTTQIAIDSSSISRQRSELMALGQDAPSVTAHVLDLLGTDLAAKLVQQELDRVALDDAAPGIDARLELRARQHRARPFHQRVQQRVFPRAQLDGFPL